MVNQLSGAQDDSYVIEVHTYDGDPDTVDALTCQMCQDPVGLITGDAETPTFHVLYYAVHLAGDTVDTVFCEDCHGWLTDAYAAPTPPTPPTEGTTTPMTGEHAMRHLKELRPGDDLDAYAGPGAAPGKHRGQVLITTTLEGPAVTPDRTEVTIDCTVCETAHTVTDSPWRLVAAVRRP